MALVNELIKLKINDDDLHFPSKYWPDIKAQCTACIWKQHRSYRQNSELNVFHSLNTFAMSIMFGIVFWQTRAAV
jgi:hypothetical protein